MKTSFALLLSSIVLTSCVGMDDSHSRAKLGAIAGAVTGAAIGSRDDSSKAAKGALIGGLAGAGIGAYMDKQASELEADLGGSGVEVSREGDNIVLNMPDSITFDTGESVVKSRFQPTLDEVAGVLAKYKDTNIEVAGHTDSVGSSASNQVLSQNRANSVRSYLSKKSVSSGRIRAIGYGESQPVASNDSSSGKAENRRVELTISPKS